VVRELAVDLDPGARVEDLLASLDLADQGGLMLVVNGRTAKLTQELEDGDEVHLIPALSGG
jgi:sulfur carrier protein ThiS